MFFFLVVSLCNYPGPEHHSSVITALVKVITPKISNYKWFVPLT